MNLLCIVAERFCRSRDAELRLGVEEKLLGSVNIKKVQSERYLTEKCVLECFQHIKKALPNRVLRHIYLLHKASLLACKYLIAAGKSSWHFLSHIRRDKRLEERPGEMFCLVCNFHMLWSKGSFELCNAADQSCAVRPAEVFSYSAGEAIVLICWIWLSGLGSRMFTLGHRVRWCGRLWMQNAAGYFLRSLLLADEVFLTQPQVC